MKNLTCLLVLGYFFTACTTLKNLPEKNCLDLSEMKKGEVVFQVNKGDDGKLRDFYPRNYLIQIFDDKTLAKPSANVYLGRGKDWEITVKLDPTKRKEYCVVIYKDPFIGGFKQMGWTQEQGFASIGQTATTYYASSKKNILTFFTTTITSKDGAAGDGVKTVIY
jgi:hypothetical protein